MWKSSLFTPMLSSPHAMGVDRLNGELETGSIILGNPQGGWFALAGAVLILSLLFISTLKSIGPVPGKWSLLGLKAVALALLTFCLFDPQVIRSRTRPGENMVVLLADESASMGIRQSSSSPVSRGDRTKEILDANAPWLQAFAREFDLHRYRFGDRLQRVESFADLSFEAPASRLKQTLNDLQSRFRHQPLAAILLVTDGNSTDGLPADLDKLGIPVFPIVDRMEEEPSDIGLGQVSISQTPFEDAPITIQAAVTFAGSRPERVVLTMELKDAGEAVTPQTQTLFVPEKGDLFARFQFSPPRSGPLFYRLSVHRQDEPDAFQEGFVSREATLVNNQRWIAVNRDSRVARLLYVGGRPNWDYKFLNRALTADPQIQLASLIRIARKEARFDFRGRAGESSNSLFRGFKSDADEETEDYSQPVLVRLNLRDAGELSDGFPQEKRGIYEYDAIILDDVEAPFFTHDQQTLLERFVSERGGGLLMLGGINSFRNGRWERTPVADALPVYLNRPGIVPGKELAWRLSREGVLEPWLRLRETEQAEQDRLQQMPPFSIVNPVSQAKPGAAWLAGLSDEAGRQSPALITQTYGQGRAAAVLVGDLWKWSLQPDPETSADAAKAWRQMIRWLVADVPQRVAVSLNTPEKLSRVETVIQTRVRSPEYQPDDNRNVQLRIQQPDGTEVVLNAPADLQEAGLYQAHYLSRRAGTYLATVELTGDDADPLPSKQMGWVSDPAFDEFQATRINRSVLEELAKQTGGELISSDQLQTFASSFPRRPMPVMERHSVPVWQTSWMLLGVLGLLATEWGWRRWKGLP